MGDSKTLDRLRDLPMTIGELPWPARRWMDDLFRDSAWHQMIKIEECKEGDSLVIRAELPGVDPDKDIQVEVVDDSLVISAEKTEAHEETTGHMHRSEFRYGSLTRSVPIPRGVDESKISATYKDGILEVHMATPSSTKEEGAHRVAIKRA
jgi:HSP20 family protein